MFQFCTFDPNYKGQLAIACKCVTSNGYNYKWHGTNALASLWTKDILLFYCPGYSLLQVTRLKAKVSNSRVREMLVMKR